MRKPGFIFTALLALATLPFYDAWGARPPSLVGPIATVADRRVEEADIRRAALVMAADPLRTRKPALWRKKLLDLCVDRELLALEADRAGFLEDPAVKHEIDRRTAVELYAVIKDRFLLPEIEPTAAQLDTARAGGLFRQVKLSYILSLTDPKTTSEVSAALRKGARFDSVAALYSVHPSASRGGDIGWNWVAEVNRGSWGSFKTAKPGDILGPYSDSKAHDFYKVEAMKDPDDAELRAKLVSDRSRDLEYRYHVTLLKRYKFGLIPTAVSPVIFAAATEKADSILASLGPDGTRPARGVRPRLGAVARVEGDSISFLDLAYPDILAREGDGKVHIEDTQRLASICIAAFLPRLIARDARERGIDREPAVARTLRLVREEVSTHAMVAKAVPPSDPKAIRAYFESHPARYRRPAARRALVAMFASEDTARLSLRAWNGIGFRDSTLIASGFQAQERATATSLLARFYAEIPLFDTDADPLSLAVRSLDAGQMSPVVQTPHGYALALVLGREPARSKTFSEAAADAALDAREDGESAWVASQLSRLRAATPTKAVPARLDAVRIDLSSNVGGKRR